MCPCTASSATGRKWQTYFDFNEISFEVSANATFPCQLLSVIVMVCLEGTIDHKGTQPVAFLTSRDLTTQKTDAAQQKRT